MTMFSRRPIAACSIALAILLLATPRCVEAAPSAGPPPIEFAKLAAAGGVDNLALSEDGRYLALADETAGTVEVWDVGKNVSRATLRTPDPRFLLWRGGTLFVANFAEGTISTFAGDALKPGRALSAGAKRVCYLSAAEGRAFRGMVLATCDTIGGSTVYVVATGGGAPRVIGNVVNGIAIATPDGRLVVEQTFLMPNSSQLCAYDAAAYVSGRHGQKVSVPDVHSSMMFTNDVTADCQPFWFAHGKGYFAEQPARTGELSLVIPDVTRDITSVVSPQFLYLYARNWLQMGVYSMSLPAPLAARLTARQVFALDHHAIDVASNRAQRFCQSVAGTVDGREHVFVYSPTDRAVFTADVAVPADLPAEPARPARITEGDMPAGRDAFEKVPVPPGSIRSMTLSDDGRFLVAAQFTENHLLVWDVVTGKLIHKLDVPQPLFVFVRRNVIYVCCQGRRVIAAYALAEGCRHLRDYPGPAGSGSGLTAPSGSAFDGIILVTGASAVYALDTHSGNERLLRQEPHLGGAAVDCSGMQVVEFGDLNPGYLRILPYRDYLTGAIPPATRDRLGAEPGLRQVRPGGPWFDAVGGLFSAHGLEMIGVHPSPAWHVAIPDIMADHFYSIGFGKVSWRRADPSLKELAARPATMPAAPSHHSVTLGAVDPGWPYSAGMPPQAVTLGKSVYIFLVDDQGALYSYRTDAAIGETSIATEARPPGTSAAATAANASGTAQSAGPGAGFPARVVEGTPVHVHLSGDNPKAVFGVVKGPPAMQIDADGTVRWTPGKSDIGTIDIKVRVEVGDDVSFQRFKVEVVSADLAGRAGGDLSAAAELGAHYVIGRNCYLGNAAVTDGVLLLDETSLTILDTDGLGVVRRATLPAVYRKLVECKDHWLAMSDKAIDVLDKKTFAVVRHIPIEADRLLDVISNPALPVSYVTRSTSTNVFLQGLSTLIELDEASWKTRTVTGVYADRIAIDPSGTRAFAAFGGAYQVLLTTKDWKRPTNRQFTNGTTGGVIVYDLAHNWKALEEGFGDYWGAAGTLSGAGLILTRDGGMLGGVALLQPSSNKLLALDAADVRHAKAAYLIGRSLDFSFHPFLKIVAACDDKQVLVFDRESGDVSERRVDFGDETLSEVCHLLFAPGGRHLLVHYRSKAGRWIVRAFPLILSGPERDAIALGIRPGSQVRSPVPAEAAAPSAKIKPGQLEALVVGPPSREMTPAEIGRKSTPAVVLLESREGFGTGFFIGSRGYILTCAHVLPSVGDLNVRFRTLAEAKEISRTATVVAADSENDLALLKIDVPSNVATVRLSRGTDLLAGEPVTVIGNPGLGRTVLQSTLTTGVVSNTDRSIVRHSFIQTSAPVNPGNSGGPMFDSHGEVIGVVVLKAHLENTAFVVPPSRIMPFLSELIGESK